MPVLNSILSTALSGMTATQQALRTTANNVTNVNTPGFAREKVEFQQTVSGGQTTGVSIGSITRVIDRFLEDAARQATADAEQFSAQTRTHDRLQSLLGRPDDNSSLAGKLDSLFAGLGDVALDPSAPARRQSALSSVTDFADEISRLSDQLQLLRADADARLVEDINKLNSLLKTVGELNPIIVREKALSVDIGGLEQQRANALNEISQLIDIRVNTNSDGSIRVVTSTGVTLLDSDRFELQFSPPGTVLANTNFSPIILNRVDSITGVADPNGKNLDSAIKGGSLRGLLDVRDVVLPDITLSVGEFAGKVIDKINGVHNDNVAVPPPNSLAGRNVGLLGTDAQSFTGKATFAVLAADGSLVNSLNFDFGALAPGTTIDGAVAAINAGLGADATLTFAAGVMTLTATNSANGVLMTQDATTPSARAGRGFSHFFGMNDLMTSQVPSQFETGFTTTDNHGFTAGGSMQLDLRSPAGDIVATHTLTISGTTFNDLLTDLNGPAALGGFATFGLDTNGALTFTPKPGFPGLRVTVASDGTQRGATGTTFSDLFGVGDSFRIEAARDVKLVDRIAMNSTQLALAKPDFTVAAGQPVVTVGDARGAFAFDDLVNQTVKFRAAGQINALSTTLGRYGATVLSNAALLGERAGDLQKNSAALKQEIETRISSASGVNMDEELANMVIFQNAFSAAARIVTTANDMFDTLLNTLR